ncbi:bacterial low temperature requirement A protein-domain-containing protein [Mortierella sp. GBAus27b]|nr:hypothetical protein BGX31_006231 [Mortierella sp. GBA43]KAI8353071.1 bacterial low temperature requirement A protein-domain-containing protein [Mortierella sp. GBAus27b]
MDQARHIEAGSSQDVRNTSVGKQDNVGHSTAIPTHHHNAFDDMLDLEQVEADDAAIARAEARSHSDFDSQGFPSGLSRSDSMTDSLLDDKGFGEKVRLHAKLLRTREHSKVTNVELFFDLVFVYAISSISQTMEHHLAWEVVLQMLIVTLAVWWAWVFSAWVFNWFNPDSYLVRLLLLTLMLINLMLSAVIPESFANQSFLFAGMYVLIQVGRNVAAVMALHGHKLQKNFIRIMAWFCLSAVLWLVGGAIGGTTRNILWTIAIVVEYAAPAAGFYTPGLGKSLSTDWEIHGGHLAERCSLFIIIALGESIVVTGGAFMKAFNDPTGVAMFIVSFVGSSAMWWIYFHTAADEAIHYVEHSADPGKMGRVAYTYIHAIMVIGIVWCAVADRTSIETPTLVPHEHNEHGMVEVGMLIGGPALFVLGHAMFRRTFCSMTPKAHLLAIAAFICATPIGIFLPIWATALTTTGILLLLSIYESYFRCFILSMRNQHEV